VLPLFLFLSVLLRPLSPCLPRRCCSATLTTPVALGAAMDVDNLPLGFERIVSHFFFCELFFIVLCVGSDERVGNMFPCVITY